MSDPVDEIMRDIGSKDEKLRAAIEKDMKSLLELGVPQDQARDTLMGKYSRSVERRIAELSGDEKKVNLVVRVASLNEREVSARGENKKVYFGFIEDQTGQCSYSMWQEPNFKVGDTIRINNAYITIWNETKRVNIRNQRDVSAAESPLEIKREAREIKIAETENFRGRARLNFVVLSLRSFENSGIEVFRGTIGDETGCALITFWKGFGVKEGETVEVDGATVTQPFSVSVSENASVSKASRSISVPSLRVSQLIPNLRNVSVVGKVYDLSVGNIVRGTISDGKVSIPFVSWKSSDIAEEDVILARNCTVKHYLSSIRLDIEGTVEKIKDPALESVSTEESVKGIAEIDGVGTVEGFIIDIREGSGLLRRCPQCNRVLKDGECTVHGKVSDPRDDLRIKAIIDDGRDCATMILNRTLTEKILGKTMDEYIEMARKAMDTKVVLDDAETLLFKPYRVKGVIRKDDAGKTLIATAIELLKVDAAAEAKKVLAEAGLI
jgi:replication factor A1